MGKRSWNQYLAAGIDPTNVTREFIDMAKPCNPIQTGAKITHLSSGFNHVVYVLNYTRVYCSGFNFYGQCGVNNIQEEILDKYTEVEVPLEKGELVKQVSSGMNHNLLLTSFGRVFFWGNLTQNQYPGFREKYGKGLVYSGPVEFELPLEASEKVARIKCSFNRSLVFLTSGRVLAVGGEDTSFYYGLPALTHLDLSNDFKDQGLAVTDAALGLWHSVVVTEQLLPASK